VIGRILLAVTLLASTAAASHASVVRDLRPTTLERGDTLIVECEGIRPPGTARVVLTGTRAGGGRETLELPGEVSTGHRVLVRFEDELVWRIGAGRRLADVAVTVEAQTADGARTYRTRAGDRFQLELLPASFRATAADVRDGLGGKLPPALVTAVIVLLAALVLHMVVAPVTGLVLVWERKVSGRMQSRLGPNRVGPRGWLQWLADAGKLITKEDLVPLEADRTLFRLSPYLMWMSVFATFVVLPLSQTAIVADMNIGLLYLLSVTSLTVIAILMGGWASNSKWSLLGGMRSAAQIVSYELPASLALLQVALLAGTLSPQGIVHAQGGLPHQWFLFANPFTFVSFFIWFIAALAEGNRTPFDLPEAESELVAGFTTEYSGFRFSVFALAEWTNMYVVGAVAAVMFLGGWNVPFLSPAQLAASPALHALSLLVMVAKIVTLVFVIIWVRWTLPRFRIDQMMALCWKYLIPIAFATFLATAAWVWLTHGYPLVDRLVRWGTFAVGGVGVAAFFLSRVVYSWRRTKLLYLGERQFTLPFVERSIEKR
jgi:NADH-quinone oxidoreductase subunit H